MNEMISAGIAATDLSLSTRWREEEVKYRKLEIVRRQCDEKVEQLRSIANLAALIAGFDVVVLIEINPDPSAPDWLIGCFAVLTAIT